MPAPVAQRIALSPHPSTPADAIGGLEVEVRAEAGAVLALGYRLWADMARIRLPGSGEAIDTAAGRAEELWKHTCFEAFLADARSSGYCELNFSPAGQWAAYHFDEYRRGMRALELFGPPQIAVRRSPERLELDALVRLPREREAGPRKLALCAVIEEENGRLHYWAAQHPEGKPDFHHPDGYVLELTFRP
ncbi:MAG TPA: DOMON-like domain-containing protein [Steroidobacteraceae bacterium]|nr:DOMON-like domain-containing protein [Steroidobacteraceae bacterium]